MNIEKVEIGKLVMNPNNPRTIKDDKFKKLVKSIKEFPEMLEVRPIVVDEDMVVLGGNMRTKACISAGLKEVYIIRFENLPEEKKKEFIIKDNVGYGEWDFDMLLEDNTKEKLIDWGMDIPEFKIDGGNENYTRKIEAPIYEPKNDKPILVDIYDMNKYNELVNEIDSKDISNDEKIFLKLSASRHIIFNFQMIADYYANSDLVIQDLMEKQSLVIIDFDKAVEYGFVNMSKEISNIFSEDYEK
jgi:hypothetical protein